MASTLGNEQLIHLRKGVELKVSFHPGHTPTLVFLHGGLGNRFNWRSQYEAACDQGRQTLVYDLAGHGDSSPYPRYSIGRHRRDLTRLLDHFGIRSPVLCCHSYGVPIGLEWAQRLPTSALILIAGGTHNLDPWWEIPLMSLMAKGGRHLFRFPRIQQLSHALISSHHSQTVEQFLQECRVPVDAVPYKALEIFWKYDFFSRPKNQDISSIPALVISGGQDPTFSHGMASQLAAHFKRSQHLHIPDAGHILMAERADIVNQAISRWILSTSA